MFALGVTMYGQMTAGSYCYIGPQGIVHGTTVSKNKNRMALTQLQFVKFSFCPVGNVTTSTPRTMNIKVLPK